MDCHCVGDDVRSGSYWAFMGWAHQVCFTTFGFWQDLETFSRSKKSCQMETSKTIHNHFKGNGMTPENYSWSASYKLLVVDLDAVAILTNYDRSGSHPVVCGDWVTLITSKGFQNKYLSLKRGWLWLSNKQNNKQNMTSRKWFFKKLTWPDEPHLAVQLRRRLRLQGRRLRLRRFNHSFSSPPSSCKTSRNVPWSLRRWDHSSGRPTHSPSRSVRWTRTAWRRRLRPRSVDKPADIPARPFGTAASSSARSPTWRRGAASMSWNVDVRLAMSWSSLVEGNEHQYRPKW